MGQMKGQHGHRLAIVRAMGGHPIACSVVFTTESSTTGKETGQQAARIWYCYTKNSSLIAINVYNNVTSNSINNN